MNPFVIWIWIGGAIAVSGALIAVWPAPEARRRRVSDVYAARLARDLAGAGARASHRMEIVLALVIVACSRSSCRAAAPAPPGGPEGESPELADLEARKEALYRQIRDAELDREQGKLSREDWERLDAELRREAIEVLKRIDSASKRG